MNKFAVSTLIFICSFILPAKTFAWGKKGHQIVAQIANHFLTDSTRKKVQYYLGKTSFEDAATWMDESKSNDFYNYMRSWHYINIDKGQPYKPVAERNIVTVLHAAIKEVKNKEKEKKSDIKQDLYMIFHLVGDLHQPMHVGYGSDRGGNDITVAYVFKSYTTNLHSVWDTDLLETESLNMDSCLAYYKTISTDEVSKIKKINELQWMKESRILLDSCYNFQDNFLDKAYAQRNKPTVVRQLLIGGIRLAAVLEDVFKNYEVPKED